MLAVFGARAIGPTDLHWPHQLRKWVIEPFTKNIEEYLYNSITIGAPIFSISWNFNIYIFSICPFIFRRFIALLQKGLRKVQSHRTVLQIYKGLKAWPNTWLVNVLVHLSDVFPPVETGRFFVALKRPNVAVQGAPKTGQNRGVRREKPQERSGAMASCLGISRTSGWIFQGSLNYLFSGDQTMQMSADFEWILP